MTDTRAIRMVLFDLDGTLADTAPDLAFALNSVLKEHGQPALPLARVRPEASHGSKALVRLGFDLGPGDAGYEPVRQRLLEVYAANLCRHTRLFEGIPELLAGLAGRGLRWGIVTNKPAYLTDPLARALGLEATAACVVSGDTTANSKPHPEPLLHACRLAGGAPADCLYVGDAERDISAGRKAGMHTLIALFGYIKDSDTPETWGADAMAASPDEVAQWLDRFERRRSRA